MLTPTTTTAVIPNVTAIVVGRIANGAPVDGPGVGVEVGTTMVAVSEPLPKSCGIAAHLPVLLTVTAAEMDALVKALSTTFSCVGAAFGILIFWLGTCERSTPWSLEPSMLICFILVM